MPVPLPDRPRAHARTEASSEIDWLALWALSMGLAAGVIAAIAYFSADDPVGAASVLFGVAALIALVLFGSAPPRQSGQ